MNKKYLTLSIGLFAALPVLATAQEGSKSAEKVKIEVGPSEGLRFRVTASSEMESERTITMNGEERDFGGRGGMGGGVTKSKMLVVWDELGATKGVLQRRYVKSEGSVTRPGRGGDSQETKVAGALAGKSVSIKGVDGRILVKELGEKGKEIPEGAVRGMPMAMQLAAMLPKEALAVGDSYKIDKKLGKAVLGFLHPVSSMPAERAQRGEGGQRGERGERGQRGERAERGQRGERGDRGGQRGEGAQRGGQRGQRGQRGGFNMFRTRRVTNAGLGLVTNDKLKCAAMGKLVSVIEKNGDRLATIEITGKITGKGDAQALGLGGGFMGQRGNRGRRGGGFGGRQGGGGNQAAAAGTSKGEAEVQVKGKLQILLGAKRLVGLTLEGKAATASETSRKMNRGGEEMTFGMSSLSIGSFSLEVDCGPTPMEAPKKKN